MRAQHAPGRPCGTFEHKPRPCGVCGGGPVRGRRRMHAEACEYARPVPTRPCARCEYVSTRRRIKAERAAVLLHLRTAPTFDALGKITRAEEMARTR